MLYIIASPIGNLEDITFRAISILKKCDLILCEDTRKSQHLLRKYEIKKKLFSYHRFNEKRSLEKIITALEEKNHIALLSDAGTPAIQDPGHLLINKVIEKGLPYTAIPGPSSILQALVLSGISWEKFQFIGYLPKKDGKKKKALQEALSYEGATIFFESPYRIMKTLQVMQSLSSDAILCLCREMTKLHEEVIRKSALELFEHFSKHKPKGEFTLVIQGKDS